MCAGRNLSFNLKLFSPLRTPKNPNDKASKVKDLDYDSDVSVLTKDIRKVAKAVSAKVNDKMSDDSDTSLFKTQLFPSQQSKKSDHDISSSDVSSSDESEMDLEELKRDLEKKAATRKQALLNKSVELSGNNNSDTLKQSPNTENKQIPNRNMSGFTAPKRKSCDSSDSDTQRKKKKPKLGSKAQLSSSQDKKKISEKISNNRKKVDVVTKPDSDSESESDSSCAELADISSVLKRTKGILKDQHNSPLKKVQSSSDSSKSVSDSDANNNVENSGLKSPKGTDGNASNTKFTSSKSEKQSQSAFQSDKLSEHTDANYVSVSDSDSDSSTKSSVVSYKNGQISSSMFEENAEQWREMEKALRADLDSSDKQSFQPPKGFKAVDFKTKRFVKMDQLKGKQLFLIKAPTKFQFGEMDFREQKIDMKGSSIICDKKLKAEYIVNVNRNPSKQVQNLRCLDVKTDGSGNKLSFGTHLNGVIHIKNKPVQIPAVTYTRESNVKHIVEEVTRPPMMPFSCESPFREPVSDEIITHSRKKKKGKTTLLDRDDNLEEMAENFCGENSGDTKVKKKKKKKKTKRTDSM